MTDNTQGLNRGHDDIANTIAAAKVANDKISNLLAIELGNEPECKHILIQTSSLLLKFHRLHQRQTTHRPKRQLLDTRGRRRIPRRLGHPGRLSTPPKTHNPSRKL
jgi:hypothetical protein